MDLIYIVTGEGQYASIAAADVRRMLADGQLSPETYFWIEGMPDWLPLHHLPPASEPTLSESVPLEPMPEPEPVQVVPVQLEPAPPEPVQPEQVRPKPARPEPIQPQPSLALAPAKPTHIAPGHAYIQPTSNRLKSTYPIALGRRVANDPEPELPREVEGQSVALPRRTSANSPWSPMPITSAQPQRTQPAPSRRPENPYLPASPKPTAPPHAVAAVPEPEPVVPLERAPAPDNPQYFAREDLEPISRVVLFMLSLCLISALLLLYFLLKHYRLLMGTYTFDDESASLARVTLFYQIAASVFAFTSLPFLVWVHRVVENIHGFMPAVRFSTGWSVGYFFVPLINLVRPIQVMQDTWKISTRPLGWADRGPSIVVAIWGLLWVAHFLLTIAGLLWGTQNPASEDSMFALRISLANSANYTALCVMTGVLVYGITSKQKRLVRVD